MLNSPTLQAHRGVLQSWHSVHLSGGPQGPSSLVGAASVMVRVDGGRQGPVAHIELSRKGNPEAGRVVCHNNGVASLTFGKRLQGWRWRRDISGSLQVMILVQVSPSMAQQSLW